MSKKVFTILKKVKLIKFKTTHDGPEEHTLTAEEKEKVIVTYYITRKFGEGFRFSDERLCYQI